MSMILGLAAAALLTAHQERPIEAPGPQGALGGTLLPAAQPDAPVALIIPGSGPTDRDGNNPMGVRASTYKLLAEALARQGVATVRIDKRGMFGSGGAVANPNAVTIPDYVADVGSWVSVIRERTGASCIWLLGHSEGGLVALAAAHEIENLCGLVLVAAPGRPLGTVLREQLRANPANAPLLDQAEAILTRLESGETVGADDMHPALLPLFAPQVQGFLASLFSYDPAALAATYDGPLLILQGGQDLQVSEADARRLAAANSGARLVVLPHVNHVLKSVESGDRQENAATYGNANLPLAEGVAEAISGFILTHARAAPAAR